MKHLVEFEMEGGGTVTVEVDEPEPEGVKLAARPGEIAAKATQTLEAALDRIKPATDVVTRKLRDIAHPPEEFALEFGLKLSAKAGIYFASADTEANFKVSMKWTNTKRQAAKPESQAGANQDERAT
ncbi:MAG TPA: CU044_2847 family protein [Blastocatellia bacterium]|nr:CU044_2847 family protein [Blastocatellia bacterium]